MTARDNAARRRSVRELRAHRWSRLARLARGSVIRDAVDGALDRLRFELDVFPHGLYQPVESLPRRTATRATGTASRWQAMTPIIGEQPIETAMDVGCNAGYFTLSLARLGIATLAVDSEPSSWRTTAYAVRRSRARNVGVLALDIIPATIRLLPAVDCTLCLSVWHHFVRAHGIQDATTMLAEIWARTTRVLFFDTGEDEMPSAFRLPPMAPDARTWLTHYLEKTCEGSRVEHLGRHAAFDAHGRPCERNLFGVLRRARSATTDVQSRDIGDS